MTKANELRKKYRHFYYQSYTWTLQDNNLELIFNYMIEPGLTFSPSITIKDVTPKQLKKIGHENIENFVFNIGLAEMLSYWKLTASPEIIIEAGYLSTEQRDWWHKLLINGMGEYFFVNQIKFTDDDFVKISSNWIKKSTRSTPISNSHEKRILIPIGGGKDSAVSLELLTKQHQVAGFVVAPTTAALDTIKASQIHNVIRVERKLDPTMLELNKQGYLNGHVPISAFFAFVSVFSAAIFDYQYIAISNERSSNEGNTNYCDRVINHQYSKTFEFETDFQNYTKKYLPLNTPKYFSFLRPIYELQIAKIFSTLDKYHPVFRSCNRGQKTNTWCGVCSKCLFAYTILYPFIDSEKLDSYFGKDLFQDETLWSIAQELLGIGAKKPLECVGTHEETIIAFYLSIKKNLSENKQLPPLLQLVNDTVIKNEHNLDKRTRELMNSWNEDNAVPDFLSTILKQHV